MNLPKFMKRKKKKKFIISLEFETEAKTVDEVLKLAEKLRHAIVSVKEKKNERAGLGPF